MGALRQAPAEGNVLGRQLVKKDHEVVGRDTRGRDDPLVEFFDPSSTVLVGWATISD
jgi:hypothetical protein